MGNIKLRGMRSDIFDEIVIRAAGYRPSLKNLIELAPRLKFMDISVLESRKLCPYRRNGMIGGGNERSGIPSISAVGLDGVMSIEEKTWFCGGARLPRGREADAFSLLRR